MNLAQQVTALAALAALGVSTRAHAGGYDTPILYSARHIGMGGTAVSYVDDPSAIFHNPAGLQGTKRGSVTANISPMLGKIRATPSNPNANPSAKDLWSEYTLGAFFLVGGAYRLTDMITLGFGLYPVASAGAEYKYTDGNTGQAVEDRTRLVFLEAAPAISVQLPYRVTLGASYRITAVDLERVQGIKGSQKFLDFEMSGINWFSFKLGVQYEPIDRLKLGLTYRHKTVTKIENDKGTALFTDFNDLSTKFTLPTRFVGGVRYDFESLPLGVSSDVEYALNSQNKEEPLVGTINGTRLPVANLFRWTNAWTVRVGAEYRLLDRRLPLRVGYAWDQKTSNPAYPTAFGTPPGDSHIATAGAGWDAGTWQINAAGAYRTGTGETTIANDSSHDVCQFCGYTGDKKYAISMIGLYLDASVNFN